MVFPGCSCLIASFPLHVVSILEARTCSFFFQLSRGRECWHLGPTLGPCSLAPDQGGATFSYLLPSLYLSFPRNLGHTRGSHSLVTAVSPEGQFVSQNGGWEGTYVCILKAPSNVKCLPGVSSPETPYPT